MPRGRKITRAGIRVSGWPLPRLVLTLGVMILTQSARPAQADPYPVRWFYLQTNFKVGEQAARAIKQVEQAAALGLNGVVVADSKFFTLEKYGWDAPGHPYRQNVTRFVETCKKLGIEVIPYLPGASRAESILAYDPNMAAGYEVRNSVFQVRNRVAELVRDPAVQMADGDFELADGSHFTGWGLQDRPGLATMPDAKVFRSGRQSVMLNPAQADQNGLCRLNQTVKVRPHRRYRVSVWVKTQELTPDKAFKLEVYGKRPTGKNRALTYDTFDVRSTQGWTQVSTVFNSLHFENVAIVMGLWGARSGRAWLDGAEMIEMGPVNILRRPGCPLTITSEDGKTLYREMFDYEPVVDPKLGYSRFAGTYDDDHPAPAIRMRPDFPEGSRLLVSYYHPIIIHRKQVDCCLTEEGVYVVIERAFKRLDQLLGSPKRYMLGQDELRTGASCHLCQKAMKTPGQLLADHIRRYMRIVQSVRPDAEIIIWNDMFDPAMNARSEYYLLNGPTTGAWEGLPKDTIICAWAFNKRDDSLRFFAERGFRVIGSADLDHANDPAAVSRSWIGSLDAVPGAMGLMYMTWKKEYEKMSTFAEVLKRHDAPAKSSDTRR
jgi:hypothetical protein